MSYVSGLSLFQLPTANLKTQNSDLNATLAQQAKNNGGGISSASGIFYKHDLSTNDKYDTSSTTSSDPTPLCINGPDWSDSTASNKSTPNLSGSNDTTTVGCVSYGRNTAFSDINVIKGGNSCLPSQFTYKALTYPDAYDLEKAGLTTDEAMKRFGPSSDYALCVSYDVLSPTRLADIQFVSGGSCPAGYTADPTPVNGFTLCKSFSAKPSAAVLAQIQKEQDDIDASKARQAANLAAIVEEAKAKTAASAFSKLTLVEQVETSKTYQLYGALGTLGCFCVICICLIVYIYTNKSGNDIPLQDDTSASIDFIQNYA